MRPAPPPPPHRSRALLVAVLAAASIGAVVPAGASEREGPSAGPSASAPAAPLALAQPSPDLPGLPPVSRDLLKIAVDSPAFRRAQTGYDAAAHTLVTRQDRRAAIDRSLVETDARRSQVRSELVAARARAAGATARLEVVDDAIADLAVSLYLGDGANARVQAALATEQPSINDADRRDVLGSASLDVLLAERAAYQARLAEAQQRIEAAESEAADLVVRRDELATERVAAADAEVAAAAPVATARVAYEEARVLATVKGVEFPLVALDAYYRAAASSAEEDPACGVRWWAIAGIAKVEGRHGTYGGAALDKLGDATRRIIGIQLNGTNQTQVVTDTDGGALDGDPAYDRAVGPMQFIPQTWTSFQADGNDDGVTTPFNLYDATLAAARYLCRASRGLDADPGLRVAYFSYNHSDFYVDSVLSYARLYERSLGLHDPRD
jgi:membrane-bound lytic murein transglycosylase B